MLQFSFFLCPQFWQQPEGLLIPAPSTLHIKIMFICFHSSVQFNISPGPGMWGGGAQPVDNGTTAWAQASDAATSWGEPDGKASGWGTPSPNSSKPGKYM